MRQFTRTGRFRIDCSRLGETDNQPRVYLTVALFGIYDELKQGWSAGQPSIRQRAKRELTTSLGVLRCNSQGLAVRSVVRYRSSAHSVARSTLRMRTMDIWKHCLMSQRKFGGQAEDYFAIHRFIDSSKLSYFHAKHRLLLHNTFGIELAAELFRDHIKNADGRIVLVRDIVAEHCKEDLSGRVPTLFDWLHELDDDLKPLVQVPDLADMPALETFVLRPYLRSGLRSALLITCSDFGVTLAELFLGSSAAKTLADRMPTPQPVQRFLRSFRFTERWQYTPMLEELKWLQEQADSNNESNDNSADEEQRPWPKRNQTPSQARSLSPRKPPRKRTVKRK